VTTIGPQLSLQSTIDATVNDLVNPITCQYNLGVERQLPANIFAAIRYVGARSNKLFSTQRYNYFSGTTGARLNPAYGAIDAIGNYGDSNYNSLQIESSHPFSHGFQIRGNYTYSKDLDDVSQIFATFAAPAHWPPILHRANSARTVVTPHMITATTWSSPTYGRRKDSTQTACLQMQFLAHSLVTGRYLASRPFSLDPTVHSAPRSMPTATAS
jgi:hypothetical protein